MVYVLHKPKKVEADLDVHDCCSDATLVSPYAWCDKNAVLVWYGS